MSSFHPSITSLQTQLQRSQARMKSLNTKLTLLYLVGTVATTVGLVAMLQKIRAKRKKNGQATITSFDETRQQIGTITAKPIDDHKLAIINQMVAPSAVSSSSASASIPAIPLDVDPSTVSISLTSSPSPFLAHCPLSGRISHMADQSTGLNYIEIQPTAHTDLWQRTHYDFCVDNAPALGVFIDGDFVMSVHIRSTPQVQYDQAGLLVRHSSESWLKTSVEFEPNEPSRMGAVVTNFAYSDWSTQEFSATPKPGVEASEDYWLRIRRECNDYIVDFSRDGQRWTQLRMCHLHQACDVPVFAGIYACAPQANNGFVAKFHEFKLKRGRIETSAAH